MWVRSRILLLVDSMSPWERPVSSATSIASRWVAIRRWSCTNAGIGAARPVRPSVERDLAFFPLTVNV